MLSVYEITKESSFHIKGFDYKITDLILDSGSAELFTGGTCLVFRLRPTDYHRYCYIDDGIIEENHFIQGSLYSVQDAACRRFKVYSLNRRSWTIMRTKHFGAVAQIEVGAFSVGGIINHDANCRIRRGDEKGYFDLHGSTIVILLQKGKAKLFSAVKEAARHGQEFPVKAGSAIGKNDF
jgi:Phosphatidylserine decarboxylase